MKPTLEHGQPDVELREQRPFVFLVRLRLHARPEIDRRNAELGKARHSEVTLLESQEASQESQVETLTGQVDAARALLSFLTGQDLGPTGDTNAAARTRAASAWKEWWKKQGGR